MRFEVDVPAVDALSAGVTAAGSRVRETAGLLGGVGGVDAGDAGLTAALAGFGQGWGLFTAGCAQTVDATGAAVALAAAAYQHVDARVIADPGTVDRFVADVAGGGDGQAALDGETDLPPHGSWRPR